MIVYEALWFDDNDYTIGIFSTKEKAQAACQQWHNIMFENNKRLLWIGQGDTLTANTSKTSFEINPIELDRAYTPEEYAWYRQN